MDATERARLCKEFLDDMRTLPDGEKIMQCIQCGTCSASCPVGEAMDFSPRRIISALRAGDLDVVLSSNTVWLCASCYSCTVRCPAGIPFTDVMYELKRLSADRAHYHKDAPNVHLARAFMKSVERHGRAAESELMGDYFISSWSFFQALEQLPLAVQLWLKGRLKPMPHTIRGLEKLNKMLETVKEAGR